MKVDQVPVLEVTGPCSFRTPARLEDHVLRHVLEKHDERWHQLLGMQAVVEARNEWVRSAPNFGPRCQALAALYEREVSGVLEKLCAKGEDHAHVVEYRTEITGGAFTRIALQQDLNAWPQEERLLIVASTRVSQGSFGAFYLRTGYRPYPKLSAKAHGRKVRELLLLRQTLRPRLVLAVHDGDQDGIH
jgi:hypothetical protein